MGGGVEAPAGNETDPAGTYGQDTVTAINPLLDPIRSTTYEVGTKGIALGRDGGIVHAVSYDAAFYWTTVRNEIVPYRGGRFYFTAGKARRAGAELGLRVDAAHGLSLEGALTYSDNRYRSYVVDSAHYGAPGHSADYSGRRVVGVPDIFYGATLGYAPSLLGGIRLRLGAQGTGRYFADDANTIRVPGYTTFHASVGLDQPRSIAGGLALDGSISVNNLTDRRYTASAFLNPDMVGGVPVAFEPGLPRGVAVSVSVVRRK
jgi:iron complex outermembrane receptor protein